MTGWETQYTCRACDRAIPGGACLYTDGRWWTICAGCGRREALTTATQAGGMRFERRNALDFNR